MPRSTKLSRPEALTGRDAAIVVQKLAHWIAHGFAMSPAFSEGRCAGRAIVQHNRVAGRSEIEIGWAVARDMWGRGIATQLGQHALATDTAVGFDGLSLSRAQTTSHHAV